MYLRFVYFVIVQLFLFEETTTTIIIETLDSLMPYIDQDDFEEILNTCSEIALEDEEDIEEAIDEIIMKNENKIRISGQLNQIFEEEGEKGE